MESNQRPDEIMRVFQNGVFPAFFQYFDPLFIIPISFCGRDIISIFGTDLNSGCPNPQFKIKKDDFKNLGEAKECVLWVPFAIRHLDEHLTIPISSPLVDNIYPTIYDELQKALLKQGNYIVYNIKTWKVELNRENKMRIALRISPIRQEVALFLFISSSKVHSDSVPILNGVVLDGNIYGDIRVSRLVTEFIPEDKNKRAILNGNWVRENVYPKLFQCLRDRNF